MINIHLLGPCCVQVKGTTIAHWPRKDALQLLKLLAVELEHRVSRRRINDTLWPATESNPEHRLNNALYGLRNALEPERQNRGHSSYVCADAEAIWLAPPEAVWIDIDHFERLLDIGLITQDATREISEAIALYRGDLLPQDHAAAWTVSPRKHLRQRYLGALRALSTRQKQSGSLDASIATLQQLTLAAPDEESAHRELIELLVRQERHAEARQQFERCREALARELGTAPSERTRAMLVAPSDHALPAQRSMIDTDGGPTQSPRFTPPSAAQQLIARQGETQEVCALLRSDARLVTLTGPGGVGKTQLAITIANALSDDFAAGACYVALDEVSSARAVASAIGRALGLKQSGQTSWEKLTTGLLAQSRLLLVLDNFEHVLDAAPLVSRLILAVPGLKILCTSRARLDITGEIAIVVPPLELPGPRVIELSRVPSVALFVQRARAIDQRFSLNDANAKAIAALCCRLDGLPLAIELAATRVNLFGCDELKKRLEQSFELLNRGKRDSPDRHRSLEAVLQWGYDLLPEHARQLFKWMSMFAGGITVNSAKGALAIDAAQVESALEILLVNHLVLADDSSRGKPFQRRFRMLQTVRAYALDQLAQDAGQEQAWEKFARYWAVQSQRIGNDRISGDARHALYAFEEEYGNFESAIGWAGSHDHSLAHQFVATLAPMAGRRGFGTEVLRWISSCLPAEEAIASDWHARASYAAAALLFATGNYRGAIPHLEKILLPGVNDDMALAVRSLALLGTLFHVQGELGKAIATTRKALSIAEGIGDQGSLIIGRINLGEMLVKKGGYEEARSCYEVGLQNVDSLSLSRVSSLHYFLSQLTRLRGQHSEAQAFGVRCVEVARSSRDLRMLGWALAAFGEQLLLMCKIDEGIAAITESAEINAQVNDRALVATVFRVRGVACVLQGRHAEARALLAQAVATCRQVKYELDLDVLWLWLVRACWSDGQPAEAEAHLDRLLLLGDELHHYFLPCILEEGARCLVMRDELQNACFALGQANDLRERFKLARAPAEQDPYQASISALQARLGENPWQEIARAAPALDECDPLGWLRACLSRSRQRPPINP